MASPVQDKIAFLLNLGVGDDECARHILLIAADQEVHSFIEFIPEHIKTEIKIRVSSPPKTIDDIRILKSYNLRPEAYAGLTEKQIKQKLENEELQEKLSWFRAVWRFHKYFYGSIT